MNSKSDPKSARRDKSDLIDLSESDESSTSVILNLFDPLSYNIEQINRPQIESQPICQHGDSAAATTLRNSTRSRPSGIRTGCNQLIDLKKANDRRLRTNPNRVGLALIPPFNKDASARRNATSKSQATKKQDGDPSDRLHESKPDEHSSATIKSSDQQGDETTSGNTTTSDLKDALGHQPFKDTPSSSEKARNLKLARKHQRSSQELVLLTKKLKTFRSKYKHDDGVTNPGLVYSPTLYSSKVREMSVKIIIESPMATMPINFTSNASTTVEHLISHAVCSMFDNLKEDDNMENYMLKVTGKDEYFDSKLCLADYALVSHCWKFDLDVKLTLIRTNTAKRPYLRTTKDDYHCKSLLCSDDLLSRSHILKFSDLNYESVDIIIETFDRESERLYQAVTNKSTSIQTQSLLQVTKQVCSLMANCETSEISESKDNLAELCRSYKEEGHLLQEEDRYKMIEVIQHAIKKLMHNMHRLLKLFSLSLPVDYKVIDLTSCEQRESFVDSPIELVREPLSIRVKIVAQPKPDWLTEYQEFHLRLGLMHGEMTLCSDVAGSIVRVDNSFFPRLLFDQDLVLSIDYSNLPREARYVITLFGARIPSQASGTPHQHQHLGSNLNAQGQLYRSYSSASINSTTPVVNLHAAGAPTPVTSQQRSHSEPIQNKLAVAMSHVFDHDLQLKQGDGLLYLHPISDNGLIEEDIYFESICDRQDPILLVEFKRFPPEKKIYFPHSLQDVQLEKSIEAIKSSKDSNNFESLVPSIKRRLNEIIFVKQIHDKLSDDEKTLVWENRLYLLDIPAALPKLLVSVPGWSVANLEHIYSLLEAWAPLSAVDAIQLLLPAFPDVRVRHKAVEWIDRQSDDELCDYMPQLLQAFRYERSLDCRLLWLLNERALKNVRVANLAYWQIKLNSLDSMFQERSDILNNCLLWVCGAAFWKAIDKQQALLSMLTEVSKKIKKVRDGQRTQVLRRLLESVQDFLNDKKPTMPWSPSLEVCDITLDNCSYFTSNTLPLKLAFRSCERSCNQVITFHTYDTMFKLGDDLRQDMLAIQMIRIMEKLWLREGLDLRMVTFDCLATNNRQGLVEIVQDAETLRKIHQNSSFLTGPFNPKAINNYIKLWNTSELEYKTAVDNFLHSCAGYSVATYILGICDRHNDNIMITTSGHLFHIDFGKFLGDAQMLGNIKRDRTPFVLTADMAYVINGGERPSKKFQTFIELCTLAFNIIRRNRNIFLNLFSLMSSAKIHGLNGDSVNYIDKLLMPNLTEIEAMVKFTRLIEDCLSSRFTQVNFFIHNLAQLKFSQEDSSKLLLSFVPKTFTAKTDGFIESLNLIRLIKLYEPEKQYYYIVQVKRVGQPLEPNCCVMRTFGEFSELQMKLNCMFPYCNFHDISRNSSGSGWFLMDFAIRTNTREVAHRRLQELRQFLAKLMSSPPEILHCHLIYTFFHPILRDQQQASISGEPSASGSQVGLSYQQYASTGGGAVGGQVSSASSATYGGSVYSSASMNDSTGSSDIAHWPGGDNSTNDVSLARRNELYLAGSRGQIKLSLSYKNGSLIIMVMHAKNLISPEGSPNGPNCYVKTYLQPDPAKQTKKKTRVIRQSCHPSFMELIVYRMPLDQLKRFTLQVAVWHSELVQNKLFLGQAHIRLDQVDLSQETTAWYPLKEY